MEIRRRTGSWKDITIRALLCLTTCLECDAASVYESRGCRNAIASYRFSDGGGASVRDSSGNGRQGALVGGGGWSPESSGEAGLLFTGTNRVSIQNDSWLDGLSSVTLTAWVRGRGSDIRWIKGPRGFRSAHFQVVGDRVFLATNADILSKSEREGVLQRFLGSNKSFKGLDNSRQLWTGIADSNLLSGMLTRRLELPFGALEPKLQVVGNEIQYEYFGPGEDGRWHIWTARTDLDGGGWKAERRTDHQAEYGVEQSFGLQAVGDRVYFGFPQKDDSGQWQVWTASYRRDGTDYTSTQRTTEGGWIPSIQVAGDYAYYMYVVAGKKSVSNDPVRLLMARTRLDGTGWEVIRDFGLTNFTGSGWGAFFASNGRVYFVITRQSDDALGRTRLITGSMKMDGSDYAEIDRSDAIGTYGVPNAAIQVVGRKIYYAYHRTDLEIGLKRFRDKRWQMEHWGSKGFELWLGESNTDGSGWKTRSLTRGMDETLGTYKAIQVVGAKMYLGGDQVHKNSVSAPLYGVMGSTIVGRGDAFGIGMTDTGTVRAFINAGEDYLVQGTAPADTSGATADADIDEDWHHVAMTYDGESLTLYVDGAIVRRMKYVSQIRSLPLPLVIGDGFQGLIRDVCVFGRPLTSREILDIYKGGTTLSPAGIAAP